MFQKLSVLVPTRNRPGRLAALLESFDRTSHGDDAELVFRVDHDDDASQHLLASTSWTVVVGPRLDGYRSLPRFFEDLRQVATGDVLMTGNDDMVCRTPNWPAALLQVANQYPDGVFALGVETHNAKVFPFAAVSRRSTEAIGHLHNPRLVWGDIYLRDIYAHFDRAIRVPEVCIEHQWAGWAPDETFRAGQQQERRNHDDAYKALHRQCVADAIHTLEAACLLSQ